MTNASPTAEAFALSKLTAAGFRTVAPVKGEGSANASRISCLTGSRAGPKEPLVLEVLDTGSPPRGSSVVEPEGLPILGSALEGLDTGAPLRGSVAESWELSALGVSGSGTPSTSSVAESWELSVLGVSESGTSLTSSVAGSSELSVLEVSRSDTSPSSPVAGSWELSVSG